MKIIKKTLSLTLVLALLITGITVNPKSASAAGDSVLTTVEVIAPYQVYYNGIGSSSLSIEDPDDDYGIGLPTGEDAKLTAMRALADTIRQYILKEVLKVEDYYDATPEQKEEANKLMPNYIKVEDSAYGLSLIGLSEDGEKWNTGVFADGSEADGSFSDSADGYWAPLVAGDDGKYKAADPGLSDYILGQGSDEEIKLEAIKLVWVSYTRDDPENPYAASGIGDISDPTNNSGVVFEGEKSKFTLSSRELFDPDQKESPVEGAKIEVYNDSTHELVDTATTDSQGNFSVKGLKSDLYMIRAYLEDTDAQGRTFSRLSGTYRWLDPKTLPEKAKKVKAKVSGKKSAKKKNIIVSWKNGSNTNNCSSTVYKVYISKKKSSGYKLAGEGTPWKTKLTIKKKKKGTYYIKIKTTNYYSTIGEDLEETESVTRSSKYTTPIKVKVK